MLLTVAVATASALFFHPMEKAVAEKQTAGTAKDYAENASTDNQRLMDPKYIEVTGIFTPRGGISIYPYANYGRPGTKYEQLAEYRLQQHDL